MKGDEPDGIFLGRAAGCRGERVPAKCGTRDSWTGLWVDDEWFAEGESQVIARLAGHVERILDNESVQSTDPKRFEWEDEIPRS